MINIMKKHAFLIIIIISLFVAVYRSWDSTVIFTDEFFIEDASYTMAQSNSFLLPTVNGEIYIAKPPLLYWLYVPLYYLFSPQAWILRFWMIIFGVLLVAVTYLLSRSWFGEKVAFLSCLFLIFSWPYIYFTKTGNFDLPNAFFSTLTVYFYNRAYKSFRSVLFMIISIALGILNRSFLALIPIIIIGTDYLIFKKYRLPLKTIIIGALLLIVIVLPWHIVVYYLNPGEFINQYLNLPINRHVLSVVTGDQNTTPFYYFFIFLMFPAVLLTAGISIYLIQIKKFDFGAYNPKKRAILQIAVWILFPVLILTLSATRHEWYVIPIYPALSIGCSVIIIQGFRQLSKNSIVYHLTIWALISLLVAPIFALIFFPLPQADLISAVVALEKETGADEPVYIWHYNLLPVTRFYPRRPVKVIDSERLQQLLMTKRSIFLLLRSEDIDNLKSSLGMISEVIVYHGSDFMLLKIN